MAELRPRPVIRLLKSPARADEESPAARRSRAGQSGCEPAGSGEPLVLLVAAELPLLRSYLRSLRSAGARVIPVESKEEALAVLAANRVDVVVADHCAPALDGIRLLREAKVIQPDTVGVLIAGAASADSEEDLLEERIRQAGVHRFLPKPCEDVELCAAVREAIRRARFKEPGTEIPSPLRSLAFRQIFFTATDPMVVADLEGNILEVNHAFLQRLGGAPCTALARRPTLVSGWDLEWAEIKASLDREGSWSGEVSDHTGNRFAVLSISVVRDEQQQPFALAACEKDVTAERMAERERFTLQQRLLLGLSNIAEFRDPETGAHLQRIRSYCRALALELSRFPRFSRVITAEYVRGLDLASPLHDVGKVAIPDEILLKPGKLTAAEFAIMKMHSQVGAEILAQIGGPYAGRWPWLRMAQIIAHQHHEKFDGSGYPQGLRGDDIDPAARIVALADAYDAITSDRVYQKARPHAEARRLILEGDGTHFDPDVVHAFLNLESTFLEIYRANGFGAGEALLDPDSRRHPSRVLRSIAAILDAQQGRRA